MIVSFMMIGFCLLVSFCLTEILILHKLMHRLKWFRKYVLEFIAIQDGSGQSLESYMFKSFIPTYIASLSIAFLFVLGSFILVQNYKLKLVLMGLGLSLTIFNRLYNSKFLKLLWEKVLPPIS